MQFPLVMSMSVWIALLLTLASSSGVAAIANEELHGEARSLLGGVKPPDAPFSIGVAAIKAGSSPAATVNKACQVISMAGRMGVKLVAFAEGLFAGAPDGQIPAGLTSCISQARVSVVVPLAAGPSKSSVAYVAANGQVVGVHRKTSQPQTGDGSDLFVADLPGVGRVCSLLGSEAYVMLARYTYYTQNCQFFVVPGDLTGPVWAAKMKSIAREARAFVISVGKLVDAPTVVDGIEAADGGAIIANPQGQSAAGPVYSSCTFCTGCAEPPRYSPAWANKTGCAGEDIAPPSAPSSCTLLPLTTSSSQEYLLTAPATIDAILMSKVYQDNVGNYHSKWVWDILWNTRRVR